MRRLDLQLSFDGQGGRDYNVHAITAIGFTLGKGDRGWGCRSLLVLQRWPRQVRLATSDGVLSDTQPMVWCRIRTDRPGCDQAQHSHCNECDVVRVTAMGLRPCGTGLHHVMTSGWVVHYPAKQKAQVCEFGNRSLLRCRQPCCFLVTSRGAWPVPHRQVPGRKCQALAPRPGCTSCGLHERCSEFRIRSDIPQLAFRDSACDFLPMCGGAP